jgi:hypothetical protein
VNPGAIGVLHSLIPPGVLVLRDRLRERLPGGWLVKAGVDGVCVRAPSGDAWRVEPRGQDRLGNDVVGWRRLRGGPR